MTCASGLPSRRPFTRAAALRAGLTDTDLHSQRYQRVFAGVYVDRSVTIDVKVRAEAALLVCPPGSYVSHLTAALLWDLYPPDHELTHVTVPASAEGSRRRGIKAHELAAEPDVAVVHGLCASSPVRTFLDLAGAIQLVDLVVVGDRLVQLELATPADLVGAAAQWQGKGARLARRAARFVRAGVESAMESRLRMLIVLAGLPEPQVNLVVECVDGRSTMRLDLSYPAYRVAVEYDGRQHAENSSQWKRDVFRREQLDRLHWRLVVVVAAGIFAVPEDTLIRVRTTLLEAGARDLPDRFRAEWRHHFGARPAR